MADPERVIVGGITLEASHAHYLADPVFAIVTSDRFSDTTRDELLAHGVGIEADQRNGKSGDFITVR